MEQPPLTALRAFEAAARHLSFSRAADELRVTPAALSFQIKQLEDHLGQPVFQRQHRNLSLTPLGQALLPGTRAGFDQIRTAWREAQRSLTGTSLTVTAGPAFTSKWLAPRLFGFARADKLPVRFLGHPCGREFFHELRPCERFVLPRCGLGTGSRGDFENHFS